MEFPYLVETGKFVVAMCGFDNTEEEFQHTFMSTCNGDTRAFKSFEAAKIAADEWTNDNWGKPVVILQVVSVKGTGK